MPVIVVANPKGGVGKSTLATNIAGAFARQGYTVMIGDVDRQQSARNWLRHRPANLPVIHGWDIGEDGMARPPKGTTHAVLDTPAGLHGKKLDEVMKLADKIIVPLQPSLFDIEATHEFMREVQGNRRGDKVSLAVVGMRAREGFAATTHLQEFLGGIDVPVLGYLRDTQNYVHMAARGLSLWDVAPSRVERDLEQWQPLLKWLAS